MSTTETPAPTKDERVAAKIAAKKERVPLRRVIPWSTHMFTTAAMMHLLGFFTIYATDTLALNPAIVGGLLVASKVIDAIGALLSGYIVDRAPETRFGKARPFELVIIPMWALAALMYSTPGSLGEVAKYVWVFASYILLTAVFLPLYQANNPLFTARVFPRRAHYSDVAAKSGLVTVVFAIIIGAGMPAAVHAAGKDPAAWSLVALCIAVPATIIGLIRFWMFRESSEAAEIATERVRLQDVLLVLRTNPYIWAVSGMALLAGVYGGIAAGTYYFRYIVGNVALQGVVSISYIVLIPVMAFVPALIRRFSVSRMIAFTSLLGAVGLMIMTFAGDNLPLIMLSAVLAGTASLPIAFLVPILVIDNATYNEWKGHRRLESVGGSLSSFAATLGQAVAAGILGLGLVLTGYAGSADVQSPSAMAGIIALNSWIPAIFCVITGFIALFYHRMENNMKAISAEVIARRQLAVESHVAPGAVASGEDSLEIIRGEASPSTVHRKDAE